MLKRASSILLVSEEKGNLKYFNAWVMIPFETRNSFQQKIIQYITH